MKDFLFKIPFFYQFWTVIRRKKILDKHDKVSKEFAHLIEEYSLFKEEEFVLCPKKELDNDKIIWQYWGQGVNSSSLPEVVQLCFESVDKFKNDYTVIRLDDNSIRDYIEFPEFIWEKLQNGKISRTFFSDILRLALLNCYGGVWLDATILMTGPLESKYIDQEYFMFQRSDTNPNKLMWENSYSYYWGWYDGFKVTVLNSIIYANRGNSIIHDLLMLLIFFWKKNDKVLDYFMFQIFYHEYVNKYFRERKCLVVDDSYPHVLQTLFNNNFTDIYDCESALKLTTTHKMSYFDEQGMINFRDFVNNKLK